MCDERQGVHGAWMCERVLSAAWRVGMNQELSDVCSEIKVGTGHAKVERERCLHTSLMKQVPPNTLLHRPLIQRLPLDPGSNPHQGMQVYAGFPHDTPRWHLAATQMAKQRTSSNACTPTLSRFTPSALYALRRGASKVAGSASSDTSASAAIPKRRSKADRRSARRSGGTSEGVCRAPAVKGCVCVYVA